MLDDFTVFDVLAELLPLDLMLKLDILSSACLVGLLRRQGLQKSTLLLHTFMKTSNVIFHFRILLLDLCLHAPNAIVHVSNIQTQLAHLVLKLQNRRGGRQGDGRLS